MDAIDSHFHWYPRSHFERMTTRLDLPRTERVGEGYRYYFDDGADFIPLPEPWFDLEAGLAAHAKVTGERTAVVCTAGVLSGLLDLLPIADAGDLAAEYNREIAGAQQKYPGLVTGTAMIPLQETPLAMDLLDDAITGLGLRGVNLPPVTNGEPIDVPRLEPFYARVAELGVPLIIHPTDYVYGPVLTGYDGALHRTIGRLLDSSVTTLRLIFSGIMHRHPALKVLQTHAGGLNPYQAGRIDKNARLASLPQPPSSYLKRVFVDTVAPQPLTIETAVRFYGVDRVLYGTDYPCWNQQAAYDVLNQAQLGERETDAILRRNAMSIFDLQLKEAP